MKFLLLSLALLLAGCGSTGTKQAADGGGTNDFSIDIGDDENEKVDLPPQGFQKKQKLAYNKADDHYEAPTAANALASESADRMGKSETAGLKDPLGTMMVTCYQRNFEKGFAIASELFDTHQNLPTYWNQVATCHLLQGSERKALLFYNKALEVTPNYVPALNNIGVIYSKSGQDQKALVAFQKALANGKFTKTPRYNLAFMLLRYGLAEEALGHFRGLSEEAPQDAELRIGLANALALTQRWPEAWEQFGQVPAELRRRSDVGLNMALAAQHAGDPQSARSILDATEVGSADRDYAAEIRRSLGE